MLAVNRALRNSAMVRRLAQVPLHASHSGEMPLQCPTLHDLLERPDHLPG